MYKYRHLFIRNILIKEWRKKNKIFIQFKDLLQCKANKSF